MKIKKAEINSCVELLKMIGLRIMQARKELGINQRVLSKNIGINFTSLSRIESGKINITIDTICNIANSLNKPIEYFFTNEQQGDIYKTLIKLQQQIIDINKKKQ